MKPKAVTDEGEELSYTVWHSPSPATTEQRPLYRSVRIHVFMSLCQFLRSCLLIWMFVCVHVHEGTTVPTALQLYPERYIISEEKWLKQWIHLQNVLSARQYNHRVFFAVYIPLQVCVWFCKCSWRMCDWSVCDYVHACILHSHRHAACTHTPTPQLYKQISPPSHISSVSCRTAVYISQASDAFC